MRDAAPHAELLALIEGYCSGTLSSDDFAQLESLLLADAEARVFFRRYLSLDAALRDFGDNAIANWSAGLAMTRETVGRSKSRHRRISAILWGAVSAIVLLAIMLNRPHAEASVLGTLQQVTGDVRILAADGQTRAIEADAPIKSGDTIRTRGTQSSTVMTYRDGTRLMLVGDTSVTCGDQQSRSLIVHQGTLSASVQPQPHEKPLLLATPSAQVQVLGTRFLIEALANRTDLSVSEGRVRLVRIRDGQAVEVPDGKFTIVTEQNQLLVQDIPTLSTSWELDFERGLPEGWTSGEWVTEGLPAGSRGGVGSMSWDLDDGIGTLYGIRTQQSWMPGLFAVQKNSHLNFTFKVESSRWINVFLVTRTADSADPSFSGNYLLTDFPKDPSGRWQTISIPLANFERIHSGEIPVEDVVPYLLMFVSDSPNRKLVIDRLWITPDGPGEIELKVAE